MTLRDMAVADLDHILKDWDDVIWNGVIYKGIFHNEYEAVPLFGGEVESRGPYVEVKESDFLAITHTGIVTIGGVAYHVTEKKPDGTGMMILVLSKD